MPKKDPPFMIHKVPKTLKQRFKKACITKGRSMREVVIEFLENYADHAP